MQENNPDELLRQARKHLLNIVSILKDGKIDSAIKAVIFALVAYIKHGNLLIKQERKEYQDLLEKAVNLISFDPLVKEVSKNPLSYVPKKEMELLARFRDLPDLILASQRQKREQAEEARIQAKGERLEKGRQLLQQKYFDGAIAHFKRLCEDFPGDNALFAEIGKLLFDINHIECITFFEMAVAADPADHKSLAMMGVAFRKIRKFDQAEAAYLAALEVDKDNINYLFNLSRVYIDSGNWVKAQSVLRRVLEIDPSLEPARKGLEFASRHCRDMM
ncbi:MAG: tetratricopeptide repeat protein [Acidobacteriota bacterium]